jgi:hypothetical protein
MRFVPLIIAFVSFTTLAFGIWYRGYCRGFKEAQDEMRVELDKALKLGKVIVSNDLSHSPEAAELLRILRAQGGKGDQ